jgi:uncharacterized membrane protein YfcA
MDHSLLLLAAVPLTGFLAGFVNTLAGSGSLITLPMLILLGLPATVANGTNRVGVVLQNVVAVATFRKHGALDTTGSMRLLIPTVIGSFAGAALAVDLDEVVMRRVIGGLMLVMLAIVIFKPERWLSEHATGARRSFWIEAPVFFAIGVYGGFIQAGSGVFLIAGLVLCSGYNLVGANAIKNLIVLVLSLAALSVFIANDQVRWDLGLLLAVGQAAGGWTAARLAIARGAPVVRIVLIAVLVLSAVALLGDFRV